MICICCGKNVSVAQSQPCTSQEYMGSWVCNECIEKAGSMEAAIQWKFGSNGNGINAAATMEQYVATATSDEPQSTIPEDCEYYLRGVNGEITVYSDRVLIERNNILGFLSQGLAGTKTIPMDSIMSIQFRKGGAFANGFIQFGILGGRESTGGAFKAAEDENTVMISQDQNEAAEEIKRYIESIIMNRRKNTQAAAQPISVADEIRKFKELLDMGALTQEEFDAKKKQLLGL